MDTKLVNKLVTTQTEIAEIEAKVMAATADLQTRLATLREQDGEVRAAIKEAMEENNVKKFESDTLTITYIAPTVRKGLDTALLKVEAPGIYDKYLKETPVAASVRIKAKSND